MFSLWTLQRNWPLITCWEITSVFGMSCPIRESLHAWGLTSCQIIHTNNVNYGQDLGPHHIRLTSREAEDWGSHVTHTGTACLCMWLTPAKPWRPVLQWVESPWLAGIHICCHTPLLGGLSPVHTAPLGEDNWKLAPGPAGLCPLPFAFTDSNQYPCTVIDDNWEWNGFSELKQILEPEGRLGSPHLRMVRAFYKMIKLSSMPRVFPFFFFLNIWIGC